MKMQLPPPNNFSIANSRPSYYAQPQRQGAIVDNSVRRLVQAEKKANPKLAQEFNAILREMRSVKCTLKVDVEIREGVPIFKVWRSDGVWVSSIPSSVGRNLLTTLQETLERLQSKARIYD